jgi:hypothetical protein
MKPSADILGITDERSRDRGRRITFPLLTLRTTLWAYDKDLMVWYVEIESPLQSSL